MQPTCTRCEHPLRPQARYCARCGTAATGARVCVDCGRSNEADDNFCFHCGSALAGGSAPATAAPAAPARWLVAGILFGSLLSGGGALGWWLFDHFSDPPAAVEPVTPVAPAPVR
ncbi:MAG: zinc-ribbon domain-containing protein [Sandaracinaceae bacterium]|nr:zinc-ribbon domain-containing protein [Sandaracinaceae bacterium]